MQPAGQPALLRAVTPCVDYLDYLRITLPLNRQHFSEYWIVTCPKDEDKVKAAAEEYECRVVVTDLFWHKGAMFNRGLVLEHAFDVMGREGWITILDADVVYPRANNEMEHFRSSLRIGCLYTPLRRMCPFDNGGPVPPESEWGKYRVHPNVREWAGYCQTFNAHDPVLPGPPWHQTDWRHAGGSDTFFQALWPVDRKLRPPWECLHLGPAGVNWCGRVSPPVDGSTRTREEQLLAAKRRAGLEWFMRQRRYSRNYDHEKVK